MTNEATPTTDSPKDAKQIPEILARLVLWGAGICYTFGVIIISIWSTGYHVVEDNLIRTKYITIGALFFTYIATPAIIIWISYALIEYFIKRIKDIAKLKVSKKGLWHALQVVIAAAFIYTCVTRIISVVDMFHEGQDKVTIGGAFKLYSDTWVILLTLYAMLFGLYASYKTQNKLDISDAYNVTGVVATLVTMLFVYSHTAYQRIDQAFGGGRPQHAMIHVKDEARSVLEAAGYEAWSDGGYAADIVYENEKHIYIRSKAKSGKSISFAREYLLSIHYND